MLGAVLPLHHLHVSCVYLSLDPGTSGVFTRPDVVVVGEGTSALRAVQLACGEVHGPGRRRRPRASLCFPSAGGGAVAGGLAWPGRPRCQVGAATRLTWGKPAALLSAGAGAGRGHGLKRGNAGGRPCALLLTASFWTAEVVTVWGWLAEPQVSGSVVPFVVRKARGGLPGAISEPPLPRPPPVSCLLRGPAPPSFPSLLCQVEGSPSHLCL